MFLLIGSRFPRESISVSPGIHLQVSVLAGEKWYRGVPTARCSLERAAKDLNLVSRETRRWNGVSSSSAADGCNVSPCLSNTTGLTFLPSRVLYYLRVGRYGDPMYNTWFFPGGIRFNTWVSSTCWVWKEGKAGDILPGLEG